MPRPHPTPKIKHYLHNFKIFFYLARTTNVKKLVLIAVFVDSVEKIFFQIFKTVVCIVLETIPYQNPQYKLRGWGHSPRCSQQLQALRLQPLSLKKNKDGVNLLKGTENGNQSFLFYY